MWLGHFIVSICFTRQGFEVHDQASLLGTKAKSKITTHGKETA
jgi:hypothetical protein